MSNQDQFLALIADRIADAVVLRVAARLPAPGNAVEKLLLSMDEAAELMNLSRSTIKTMVREGELACVRKGTRVLIHRKDIDTWIANNRI